MPSSGASLPPIIRKMRRGDGDGGERFSLVVEEAAWRAHRGLLSRWPWRQKPRARRQNCRPKRGFTILLADECTAEGAQSRLPRQEQTAPMFFSFPSHEQDYRGDIASAYGVTKAEASGGKEKLRRSCHATWWCMACCIWPAMTMNANATPN